MTDERKAYLAWMLYRHAYNSAGIFNLRVYDHYIRLYEKYKPKEWL